MRVFCLGTGRCGTTTFARSLSHATNYTSGHESRASLRGPARLEYPDQHVEADNRLSWFLGSLGSRYGGDTVWVHLRRRREDVVASFAGRHGSPALIMSAFGHGILMTGAEYTPEDWIEVAEMYVDTVTANIEAFLEHRESVLQIDVETAPAGIATLWERIGAQGDLTAAQAEWNTRHNARHDAPGKVRR